MSADAIKNRIIDDARRIVNSTLEEANNEGLSVIEAARNDVLIFRDKNMEESIALRDETVRRKITSANLAVRKLILQTKQDIIDGVFAAARESVLKDRAGYKAFLESVLKQTEEGDTVILARDDSDIKDDWVLKTAAKKVTVSTVRGDFAGGIIIQGKLSDKNFTIESVLSAVKEENEIELAKILFEGK
jgi:vacuolar-type H+-ATPase subunit E/Vma4